MCYTDRTRFEGKGSHVDCNRKSGPVAALGLLHMSPIMYRQYLQLFLEFERVI